ncbi:similar to Saccharomyces cerevisiae YIL050W PCL7 Pho85p cyclin of the Pho80p subfamily [Geotrichum candidum]|nr:similar to Saccharomyces cerevisiae YIL050W PCL7 Pho85p cyclin of the Pho80p subfamily [Geotrichum candidum]
MASTTTTTLTTAPPATKGAVHATPAAASPSIPRFHFTKYTLPPFTDDEGAGDSTDTHVDQTNATGLSSSNGHESRNENGISNTSTLPGADLLHELTTEECVCILYQTVNRLLQASAESDPTGSPDSNTDATTSEDKTTALIARRFNSSARAPPPIHPWDYLLRLHHYCPMSQSVYLSASLYLTRLCAPPQLVGSSHDKGTVSPGPPVTLTPLNVHRLLLAALRIACKVIEDINFKQQRYASIAGVSTLDLYRLEIALLFLLDFDVFTDMGDLCAHLRDLQRFTAADQQQEANGTVTEH